MGRRADKFDGYLNPDGGGSVLGRIVALVVGVGAFVLSLIVGAVFLAVVVGFMLLVALIVGVRIWWLRRKMERHAREHGDIEAEYTVISTEERITRQRDRDR